MNGHFGKYLTNTSDSSQVSSNNAQRPCLGRDGTNIGFILCSLVAISYFPPELSDNIRTSSSDCYWIKWPEKMKTESVEHLVWPWGSGGQISSCDNVTRVLQNICGGGEWCKHVFGAKTILWLYVTWRSYGAQQVWENLMSMYVHTETSVGWVDSWKKINSSRERLDWFGRN